MLTKDQINTIKRVPITSYLASKELFPVVERAWEYCYFSPFTDEKTPSFFVNKSKNVFKDFGTGQGGDVVALVRKLDNVGFSQAVSILSDVDRNCVISIQDSLPASPQYQSFISKVTDITHPALKSYLFTKRCISPSVAGRYVKEVRYNTSKGSFFGVGFQNDSGGWEIRNPSFKGCIGSKSITTIGGGDSILYVFEGFINFLSWLTYRDIQVIEPHISICVLNSLSLISKIPDLSNFAHVGLFLDNDVSGIREANKITSKYKNAVNISVSEFPDHSDFNEFIIQSSFFLSPQK